MQKHKRLVFFYSLTILLILFLSYGFSSAITVLSENSQIVREHCIIIDAGHGGEDGGATSCAGILESTYNLEISLRLNDLFHLLGYDTIMVRTTDRSIYTQGSTIAQKKVSDLKERVRIVNESENTILLSIHQNTFSDAQYHGAQVFYASTPGSDILAKQLQAAFTTTINPESHRMCKKSSGIYLMDHINKPGVLIECGFLSNHAEEAKLRNPEYQQQLCCVIAATVSRFLSNT